MVEMRQFVYLDAVYKYKSFTKASKALYVSQPTISAAVRQIEQELGLTLVERTPKNVIFTPAGETIMIRVRSLLSNYNDIIAEANELSRKANFTLRLGIASILSSDVFPLLYKNFLEKHPELMIHLDEDSAHGHIKKLTDEELDLALNGLPNDLNLNEFNAIPVCVREIKLIMSHEHPLAKLDEIPVGRLSGENISMLTSPGVMGQILEDTFAQNDVFPNIVSEHSQIHGMLEMVRTGFSIGFINLSPEASAMAKYEDLVLKSFSQPLTFTIGFMVKRRKYLSSVCRELIKFITEAMGNKKSADSQGDVD